MTIHLVSTRRARKSEGFGRPKKRPKKNPNTKGSTRRARNAQARDLASPPKKGNTKNPSKKGSTRRVRNTQAKDLASPPKKGKKKTRKAAPDEQETPKRGRDLASPKKSQGSTWLDRGNLDRFWTFWDYKMVFHST